MTAYDSSVLTDAATRIFEAAGLSRSAARTVSGALVDGDARGIGSHGLMLVPMYVDRIRSGSVSTRSSADVVLDAGAIAVLDGGHALGVLTADQAMSLAIGKAGEFGVGLVVTRHAFHFGGAFRYVQQAIDAGCIGIAAANTRPLMPAPGGATAVVGNNPLAIGIPGDDPILVDMALSEAALGKIRLAEAEGREIPPTWATDRDGVATTDPTAAIAGLLLPAGGPKGYGLALAVDVLTGVLSGGSSGSAVKGLYADASVPNDCAHLCLAVDPARFGSLEGFRGRVAGLTAEIRGSRLAPGSAAVYLPGQLQTESAQHAAKDGIALAESVLHSLRRTAALVGARLPEQLR